MITLGAPGRAALTQPRINEFAAELARARIATVDAPGARAAAEPLQHCVVRLFARRAGESQPAWKRRVAADIKLVADAVRITAPIRRPPVVTDRSAANVDTWRRCSKALGYLPWALTRLRHAAASGDAQRTAYVFTSALLLEQSAYDDLRDARP